MSLLKRLIKKTGNHLSNRFNKSYLCYGESDFIHRKAILLLKRINTINIGNQVYIGAGENNNIRASGGKITIGENCLISQFVTMVTTNHGIKKRILINEQEWSKDNNFIIIDDDVWIGAGSVILPGITIGKDAIIVAGSIVTKNVTKNAIMAGNLAKLLRYRE